jgi:Lrp/AsnC family transcriptional regulator of ectoine degradation
MVCVRALAYDGSAMLKQSRHVSARKLDARDLNILRIIQSNGRISRTELAAEVGLSVTPCVVRLERLERDGFIRGYRGMLDARRLGSCLWIHTQIKLGRHQAADFSTFEKAIREIPEVVECDAVGGGIDYLLKIVTRDVDHYQRLMERLLERGIGIASYGTYIVTKRIKESEGMPIDALLAERAGT